MSTKKIYVQIVDTLKGIQQTGSIEEPVVKGAEIQNALKHFGINYGEVDWDFSDNVRKSGKVSGTYIYINVITGCV